jgi:hypothetical protein
MNRIQVDRTEFQLLSQLGKLSSCHRFITVTSTMAAPGQDAKFFQRGKIEVCSALLWVAAGMNMNRNIGIPR